MASEVPPDRLFLPLLSAALEQGADPNLGRAQRLPPEALREAAPAVAREAAGPGAWKRGEQRAGGSGDGGGSGEAGLLRGCDWGAPAGGGGGDGGEASGAAARARLAEEVLMWHRAASRLGEMTRAEW
jgi:hypothetical protein